MTALYVIVGAALAIRLVGLGAFPDTVIGDEADNVQYAARILYGQPPAGGFFGADWTPQPAFSVYKQALFIAILGLNVAALRLPSAILSALALVPFYFLLRRQLSTATSLLCTLLLATNVWYLNFSRSGWNNIDVCFYMLAAMLFLMLALDGLEREQGAVSRTWMHFGLAGLFASLGLYAYPAGRAITIALLAFVPVALMARPQRRRQLLIGFAVLFAVEIITFAPQGIFILRNWQFFNGRTNVVLVFNQDSFRSDPTGYMLTHVSRNLRGPWDGRVNNTPQYSPAGEPQLEALTGMLALAGLILTIVLTRLRRRDLTWLWWLMLLASWVSTQILTANTPNGARGIGYLPVLVYFAAVGLEGALQLPMMLADVLGYHPRTGRILQGLSALLILYVSVSNVQHYADWQRDPRTRAARYIYITVDEFSRWSADITQRALNGQGVTNLGMWRELYPIADPAHPSGSPQ